MALLATSTTARGQDRQVPGGDASAEQPSAARIAKRIDHILIRTSDPERLFELFAAGFGLPIVWPLRSYGFFQSGGVCAGNVNLEILAMPGGGQEATTHLYGIAFEPAESVEASVRLLERAGWPHSPPTPFFGTRPDGTAGVIWRTVPLPELQPPSSMVFLCEYAWNTTPRRQALSRQLASEHGGCLGWVQVESVSVGYRDLIQARKAWTAHLGAPAAQGADTWHLVDGPAVRLSAAARDGLLSLAVDVRSLQATQACLKKHGIACERDAEMIVATGGMLGDLRLQFREAAATDLAPGTRPARDDSESSPGGR